MIEYSAQNKNKISAEELLSSGKRQIHYFENLKKYPPFLEEENLSIALDEITKNGKLFNVHFISLTPGTISTSEDEYEDEDETDSMRTQSVILEIESTYKGIGTFLGSLDELSSCFASINSFDIQINKKDPTLLNALITINLILRPINETGL